VSRRPARTVRLPVRLMPEEDAALRARECGMTRARYLNRAGFSGGSNS
jgi:hypothetical protein